ncbi:MAG: PP2C family protein-serine/threonine phosphatase [Pseudomonadota bacterium]
MPLSPSSSSATPLSKARPGFAPAAVFDPLPLHAAESADELSRALTQVLQAAEVASGWSIAFRLVGEEDQVTVYLTTDSVLHVGERLSLPEPVLRVGLMAGDEAIPVARADGTPSGLQCTALVSLEVRHNHYGYLLLHDDLDIIQRAVLLALADHLALALYALQTRQERARLQALDGRKLSLMIQASSVVLRELDLERAMFKLVELAVDSVCGEVGCVALTSREGETLDTHASWGIDEAALAAFRLEDGRSVWQLATADGLACLFRNTEELQELVPCEALERITSLVALPLSAVSGIRGCLVVANAPDLDSDAIDLLKLLTEVCATSVDNAIRHLDSMERESLAEQLRLAGSIQQALLPDGAPQVTGVALDGCNLPCDDSSGDYYDYYRIDDSRIGFVVADATGHGIGAALIATTARAALRALLHRQSHESLDLAELLEQLNELAEADMKDDKFITLFAAVFDSQTGTLTYASAGHDPPMLLFRREQDAIERLEATGLPLGMFPMASYESVTVADLRPGDLMLVMTDGVDEARNSAGEQFGLDRVEQVLREAGDLAPGQMIGTLIDQHQTFTEFGKREDDITMICVRVGDPP